MNVHRDFPGYAAFQLYRPEVSRVPFLFNSPHSGRCYPRPFLEMSCLDAESIRLSEDRYIDCLFADVTALGAELMVADFPRAYLDVNREAYELDGTMFCDGLPDFIPSRPSPRVQSGLGCIPRVVACNRAIYPGKIPFREALDRISSIYMPYHALLRHGMQEMKRRFGYAILIDCHSMPGQLQSCGGERLPDIVLGDMHGRACAQALIQCASFLLNGMGYNVVHNRPYAGGYITAHYGRPLLSLHALQIEINRDLYLDPRSLALTEGFTILKRNMTCFAKALVAMTERGFILNHEAAG